MERISFQAIYRKGILKPKIKLNLPDNTLLQVQVTPVALPAEQPGNQRGSLFGTFPELGAFTSKDLGWAKRIWDHGAENQCTIILETV
jgi:hypothetical protein